MNKDINLDNGLGTGPTFRDQLRDGSLFKSPKPEASLIKAQIKSKLENLPESNVYFGNELLGQALPVPQSADLPMLNVKMEPVSSRSPTDPVRIRCDVNRILSQYSTSTYGGSIYESTITFDPMSPLYHRPVFQNPFPDSNPREREREKAENPEEIRNYYPRTSFTAQFSHLLPTGRQVFLLHILLHLNYFTILIFYLNGSCRTQISIKQSTFYIT